MKKLVFILSITLSGCIALMSGGTHGSIKGYHYSATKDRLEEAVMSVIKNNQNIYRDTTLDYLGSSPLLDNHDCVSCKAGANFYNDIKHYVTIKITSGQAVNEYTFRYYGPDKEWKTSTTSEIFICYARDKNGNGGSEGQHSFRFKNRLKNELIDIFETEFVNKIDKELSLMHNVTE